MNRHCACRVILVITSVLTLTASVSAAAEGDPFGTCRERLAQRPGDYESAHCFYQVTSEQGLWDEGARVFDALMKEQPGNAWVPLAYGHVQLTRDPKHAEHLFRQAAEAFKASAGAEGEVMSLSSLRDLLVPRGRIDEAARVVEQVVAIADASNNPMLEARAWCVQAQHIQGTGGDLGQALRLLKQAEAAVFPGGSYLLKRTVLNTLGLVAWRMGRFDEAIAARRQLAALATSEGDRVMQAIAGYNLFNATATQEVRAPDTGRAGKAHAARSPEPRCGNGGAPSDRHDQKPQRAG